MPTSAGNLREHTFRGTTQSLCPECLDVVGAKIIVRDGRVYFQKFCPAHGRREDFVCSDDRWWDRLEFNVPGREPVHYGVEPRRGCPYDCGLCTQHEQHTCIAVLEITASCNLTCPMCYASSRPGGKHLRVDECQRAIDRLVECEGRAEILQLSGGEPTIHPQFAEIFDYACRQPIDWVMVNTNGIRLAGDRALCELLASRSKQCQVYLQMDGLDDRVHPPLRGASLLETKLRAIERLGEYGVSATLVATLHPGVNDDQLGPLIRFAVERSWINGVNFQPATYVGRTVEPPSLDQRVTFPDVIRGVARQTEGLFAESDFFPVPCAHPNAHTISYAFRSAGSVIPITRFVDIERHYDLLANGISLNRGSTRAIIERYLSREACGPGCDCNAGSVNGDGLPIGVGVLGRGASFGAASEHDSPLLVDGEPASAVRSLAERFLSRALREELSAADMFRVSTTSFMDAYNFDLRQLMKSCVHHLLPSGHLIPFDAYNVLYRTSRLPLPRLTSDSTLRKPIISA